jgi:hypothetical protein
MLLFAATVFTSAFLLFLVQPIIAKQILPWFGGNASVWTVCMVFFQLVLLGGYAYADLVVRRLAPRRQAILHTALLAASLAFLPILAAESWKPSPDTDPTPRILLLRSACPTSCSPPPGRSCRRGSRAASRARPCTASSRCRISPRSSR